MAETPEYSGFFRRQEKRMTRELVGRAVAQRRHEQNQIQKALERTTAAKKRKSHKKAA